MTDQNTSAPSDSDQATVYRIGSPIQSVMLGTGLAVSFYAMLFAMKWTGLASQITNPLERYFLGHPISVAATVLFFLAMGTLIAKKFAIASEQRLTGLIKTEHLIPQSATGQTETSHSNDSGDSSPAENWRNERDSGYVAENWLQQLRSLPAITRKTRLVQRLSETLTRQVQRGSAKQLPDDLRELATRDADAAHDSYGMVRIIVWAIPMLGFLGTVIGITQTLGGLDFANGATAVENLKAGLYVAFDTTALGLVLSVLAIFLQFPVERAEQSLLAAIDSRVGAMVSTHLPSDEASDDQTALIVNLCQGVQAAVAESLERQTELWKSTVEETRTRWQAVHDHNNDRLVEAFKISLVPALVQHTESIRQTQDQNREQHESIDRIEGSLSENLQVLSITNAAINRSLERKNEIGQTSEATMADAIRTLARAMDTMNHHLGANHPVASSKATSAANSSTRSSVGRAA